MENIFKNAHFGKIYKTRDGRKAIYIGYDNTVSLHILVIENLYAFKTYRDSGNYCVSTEVHEYPEDIVSEWEEPINEEVNEEELDELDVDESEDYALKGTMTDDGFEDVRYHSTEEQKELKKRLSNYSKF